MDENAEKHRWVEQTEHLLQQRGYPADPQRRYWLENYYDERPEEWKQRDRDEHDMVELMRMIRERFGSPD